MHEVAKLHEDKFASRVNFARRVIFTQKINFKQKKILKDKLNYQPRVRKVRGTSDSNKKTKIYKKLKKKIQPMQKCLLEQNCHRAILSPLAKVSSCNFERSSNFYSYPN